MTHEALKALRMRRVVQALLWLAGGPDYCLLPASAFHRSLDRPYSSRKSE
jgi:hypothetical protein